MGSNDTSTPPPPTEAEVAAAMRYVESDPRVGLAQYHARILAAALRARDETIRAMGEWRPIATAPLDEPMILATTGGWVCEAWLKPDEDAGPTWEWATGGPVSPFVPLAWRPMPPHPQPDEAPAPTNAREDTPSSRNTDPHAAASAKEGDDR